MRITLVDDDHLELARIADALRKRFGAEVQTLATESEFVASLDSIASANPDVIILDIMLRWANPSAKLELSEIPPEVVSEGFYTAGIRCLQRLRQRDDTKQIPVILYTTLDQNDFTEYVVHTKSDDLDPLFNEILDKVRLPKSQMQRD